MRIIFSDINKNVSDALASAFDGEENVEVHHGDIFKHKAEAIVSPANSFGYMDGGIDLAYSMHFGWDLQERLQNTLKEYYHGELLVGQAVLVHTHNKEIPYLISAPTMRVPMNIVGTLNVYLAFRAALRLAKNSHLHSILCPGLGTLVGGMDPEIAAAQMKIAYKEVLGGLQFTQLGIRAAHHNHHLIVKGVGF